MRWPSKPVSIFDREPSGPVTIFKREPMNVVEKEPVKVYKKCNIILK